MKEKLKMFGAEAIYLIAATMVAALAAAIQTVGRTYIGDYSSFIWAGSDYSYNYFFYALGLILFLGSIFAGYKFFLEKRITLLRDSGIAVRIIFPLIAAVFAILMLAAMVFTLFLIVGLNDNIRPTALMDVTGFGWPIFTLVFMLTIEIREIKRNYISG